MTLLQKPCFSFIRDKLLLEDLQICGNDKLMSFIEISQVWIHQLWTLFYPKSFKQEISTKRRFKRQRNNEYIHGIPLSSLFSSQTGLKVIIFVITYNRLWVYWKTGLLRLVFPINPTYVARLPWQSLSRKQSGLLSKNILRLRMLKHIERDSIKRKFWLDKYVFL